MSVSSLLPANSIRARNTALASFTGFLAKQGVTLDDVQSRIDQDTTGKTLYLILDKYAVHLISNGGKNRELLARNSVLSYFGQVKNWLVDRYPAQGLVVDKKLRKLGSTLSSYCTKRPNELPGKQAPPCTKADLKIIVSSLYEHASSSSDYLDAALVNMMWYLYGRCSDVEQLERSQLSVYPGGMIFLRFKRVKTASQQGVSLFLDPKEMCTCPLHVLAVALAMHPTPGRRIFPQFPQQKPVALPSSESGDLIHLLESLDNGDQLNNAPQQQHRPSNTLPGAQAYVNRHLASIKKPPPASTAGLTSGLSSHSFRRGGAMHANADNRLSSLWVVDRGGWSTSSVNKAFGYMLNTTQEDQQVARQLRGWSPKAGAKLPDLSCLNGVVRDRAGKLQETLFAAAVGFSDSTWNVDDQVLEVLTATLIMHYAGMRRQRGESPFVLRVRETIAELSMPESELLAMAVTIRGAFDPPAESTTNSTALAPTQLGELISLVKSQTLQLNEILARQATLEERLDRLEGKMPSSITAIDEECTSTTRALKRIRKQPPKPLSDSWYEWFADQPRPYESAAISKSKRYEYRYAVAYMMLFLPDGFKLDTTSPAYKSEVRSLGIKAETNTLAFTVARGSRATATGPVVKLLRDLEKSGELKQLIAAFRQRRNHGEIVEPTPASALLEFARP